MDPSLLKKRKSDENGSLADLSPSTNLTPEDARKIIEPFTQEQLLEILQIAVCLHVDVLDSVRSIADRDPVQRKLFIRGLGWDTTTEGLRSLFSAYGELEEAVVILDKTTGKSKGYGFITFKHIDGAMRALKEPSKKIDGRMTVTQLAATGISGGGGPQAGHQVQAPDVSARKIYVGNVPNDMPADRLLAHFLSYGEIEEGPLGYDKQTGKSRGFALFVYKTQDAARASLVDPLKSIDGHSLMCKLAIEGKKGKPMGPATVQNVAGAGGEVPGGEGAMPPPSSMPGSFGSQYGGPGAGLGVPGGLGAPAGLSPYGVFAAAHQGPQGLGHHQPHPLSSALQSSIGAAGLSSVGSQVPSSLGGGAGGYGAGLGGGYGGLGGGPNSGGYGHGGPGAAGYGGVGYGGLGVGAGASLHRLPSGGYPEGAGHYSLSSSAFPGPHQSSASSPVPRVGPGSMYPNLPPYY